MVELNGEILTEKYVFLQSPVSYNLCKLYYIILRKVQERIKGMSEWQKQQSKCARESKVLLHHWDEKKSRVAGE